MSGRSVSTTWNRVRFDPVSYGMAGDCSAPNSSAGRANVDLTGLPFVVTANWSTNGYYAAGGSTRSSNDQVVDISGGGFCGRFRGEECPSTGAG
ncbi:hypothetical protein F0U59_07860 [Archangium gephyra]|nr:hypothetical protein F0U59_07860 [Archangium gephyra]